MIIYIEPKYTFKLLINNHEYLDSRLTSVESKQVCIYRKKKKDDHLYWALLSKHPIRLTTSNKFIFNSFYYNYELYNNLIDNGDIEFNTEYFNLKTPKIVYLMPKLLLQLC